MRDLAPCEQGGKGSGEPAAIDGCAKVRRTAVAGQHLCHAEPAQGSERWRAIAGHAGALGKGQPLLLRLGQGAVGVEQAAGRMGAGAGEQAPGHRRRHQRIDAGAARRTADDGHIVGIAAEAGDVLPDPAQRRDLIHQPEIGGCLGRFVCQRRVREEAEPPDAVIGRDKDDTLLDQRRHAVAEGLPTRADEIGAAMDDEQHRQFAGAKVGRGDVEGQAIFILGEGGVLFAPWLGAIGRKACSVTLGLPGADRLRCAPAIGADRGRGIGNAAEEADIVAHHAADRTGRGGQSGRCRRRGGISKTCP